MRISERRLLDFRGGGERPGPLTTDERSPLRAVEHVTHPSGRADADAVRRRRTRRHGALAAVVVVEFRFGEFLDRFHVVTSFLRVLGPRGWRTGGPVVRRPGSRSARPGPAAADGSRSPPGGPGAGRGSGRRPAPCDPCFGLGHGASALMAAANVWTAGSPRQCADTAELLLANGKLACVYHELAHGNDITGHELTAVGSGDVLTVNGAKEVVANIEHADAMVVFARTDSAPGARAHCQPLLRRDQPPGDRVHDLPRFHTAGMRGVRLGGIRFTDCPVPRGQHGRRTGRRRGHSAALVPGHSDRPSRHDDRHPGHSAPPTRRGRCWAWPGWRRGRTYRGSSARFRPAAGRRALIA